MEPGLLNSKTPIAAHSTRLFPKNKGASAYHLTGIASKCDWAFMTDKFQDKFRLRKKVKENPRTVFVSMRGGMQPLVFFYMNILPTINNEFVLITGSGDITVPNQVDKRFPPTNFVEMSVVSRLLACKRLKHWYIENRDEDLTKTSSLPVGCIFTENEPHICYADSDMSPLYARPLKVMCAHRVREGEQWAPRRNVTSLCSNQLRDHSTILLDEIPESKFWDMARKHPFVLCVEGGGLDPSPKVWTAIATGSIPIVRSSPLDDAYSQLPVAFVDDWTVEALNVSSLTRWIKELSPYYESKPLRERTLYRLSLDYWWSKITSHL